MNRKFYLILAIVFVASLLAWRMLPVGRVGDVVRELSGVPAIGSLLLALYQLARDRIAHERSLAMLERQNSFSIGATSHMAMVAFDKHVAFCEEYVSMMFNVLSELFQKGPCKDALKGASDLLAARKKWTLWITPEVQTYLEKFEASLRKIGVAADIVSDHPGVQGHGDFVKQMYTEFAEVMGSKVMGSDEWDGKKITGDVALFTIIDNLRGVLGIKELTALRTKLVSQALQNKRQGD